MSCSDNTLLKGVKDKQKELDSLLESGKDQLAAMNTKMAAMKVDLGSFVPVIPEVPSLQGDLLKLGDISSAGGLASKIAELKTSFGSVVPDFDSLIGGLGLDSFPPSIDSSSICETMPNVETVDDEPVVVPKESKIPEEEPKKPEPKPAIEPDKEELNKDALVKTYKANLKKIQRKIETLDPKVKRKKKLGVQQQYWDVTWPELYVEVYKTGGSNIDDMKKFAYTEKELREMQIKLEKKYNLGWDFKTEGQIMAPLYATLTGGDYPQYLDADDFATACTQTVARRKKKLG